MIGYRVTPADLIAAAAQCSAHADEARTELTVLSAAADNLFAAGRWTGNAGNAFGQGWEQWRSGAVRVIEALELTADGLRRCAHDYDTAELEAAVRPAAVGL